MKKLLEGRRYLSIVGALVVVAVVCLCLGSVGLVWDYRGQLHDAVKQQKATAQSFHDYQQGVYQRCLDRVPYDQKTDAWKQAVEGYYADLQGNIRSNANFRSVFYRRLLKRVNAIIVASKDALNRPSDAGCAVLKPPGG